MRLNLKDIIHVPGAVLPFSFVMDLSDLDFGGEHPMQEPVRVTGQVRNMAGAMVFTAQARTELSLRCDRCTKPFHREKVVDFETLLATELAGKEDQDDIIVLEGDELDAGALMRETFVLEMDSKNLCTEDCKGLCSGCGADLNVEPCRCKKEGDPRLAALGKFFEQAEE